MEALETELGSTASLKPQPSSIKFDPFQSIKHIKLQPSSHAACLRRATAFALNIFMRFLCSANQGRNRKSHNKQKRLPNEPCSGLRRATIEPAQEARRSSPLLLLSSTVSQRTPLNVDTQRTLLAPSFPRPLRRLYQTGPRGTSFCSAPFLVNGQHTLLTIPGIYANTVHVLHANTHSPRALLLLNVSPNLYFRPSGGFDPSYR